MTETSNSMSAPYFYLSYARWDLSEDGPQDIRDPLVERFFRDLSAAVQGLAGRQAVGFFDRDRPVERDLKLSITWAIGAAQVFVPLYSAPYLKSSWSGCELASFTSRLEQAGYQNPVQRLVPVLWSPLAGLDEPPGLGDAPGIKAEPGYATNGLRVLLKLHYDDLYEEVVGQIARRIVRVAESDPLEPVEPSRMPDIETIASAFSASEPELIFDFQVAAPTVATAPSGSDLDAYGTTPFAWRPFPGQELPLLEHARLIAERFDFTTQVRAVSPPTSATRQRPGIVVIDPAFAADRAGIDALRAIAGLPRWVLPLVVPVRPGNQRARELELEVRTILEAKEPPTESARTGIRGVGSLDEFDALVPVLVTQAEQQYLRHRSSRMTSPRPTKRLSLGRDARPHRTADSSGSLGRRNA